MVYCYYGLKGERLTMKMISRYRFTVDLDEKDADLLGVIMAHYEVPRSDAVRLAIRQAAAQAQAKDTSDN